MNKKFITFIAVLLFAVFSLTFASCNRGGTDNVGDGAYLKYFTQYKSTESYSAEKLKMSVALPSNYEIEYEVDSVGYYVISAEGNDEGKEKKYYGLASADGLLIDPLYNEFITLAWVSESLALVADKNGQYGIIRFGQDEFGRTQEVISFSHSSSDKLAILNGEFILAVGGNPNGTISNSASFIAIYDKSGTYLYSIEATTASAVNYADGYFWAGVTSVSGDLQVITLFDSKTVQENGFLKKVRSFIAKGYTQSLEDSTMNTNLILDFQYLGNGHFFYSELDLDFTSGSESSVSFVGNIYNANNDNLIVFNSNEAIALVASKHAYRYYIEQGMLIASTANDLSQAFCSREDGTMTCIFLDDEGTQTNMNVNTPLLYVDGYGIPFDVMIRNLNGEYESSEDVTDTPSLIDPSQQLVKNGNLNVYDKNGKAYLSLEGNYYDVMLHSDMIVMQKIYSETEEFYGAVNLKGEVIVPFEFYLVYPYFDDYTVAVKFIDENTTVAYRYDKSGNRKVITDFYEPFYGCYSYYVQETDQETQITTTKWGLKNYAGEIILPAEYQKISLNQIMCTSENLFKTTGYAIKDNQYYFFEL